MKLVWPLAIAALLLAPAAVAVSDSNVAIPDTDQLPGQNTASCSGVAPGTTSCTDGTHIVVLFPFGPLGAVHGPTGYSGYTGTIESKLSWTVDPAGLVSGARIWRCDVSNGSITGCAGQGSWPPAVSVSFITHTCASYNYKTTTPGGSGKWGCYFSYFGMDSPV